MRRMRAKHVTHRFLLMSMQVLFPLERSQALALRLWSESTVIHGMSTKAVDYIMRTPTQLAHRETVPDFQMCAADRATVVRMSQLTKMVGISRSMIYLKLNSKSRYFDAQFPKPIRLGQHAIGWLLSDIYEYIRALKRK